jgi:autotransporter adhesin
MGANAAAASTNAIAMGANAAAASTNAIAMGASAAANGPGALAVGFNAQAAGVNAIATGANAQADAAGAIAFGAGALAAHANTLALGTDARASGANTMALGGATNALADNSVALGYGAVADRANSVSVGADGRERQITHVAPAVQGTDAVNLNQLRQGIAGTLGSANSYTDDKVRSARRDANGGAAAALAVAALPQAVQPGRGMVALASGTYGGQSAFALGVSQLSDDGKWAYKAQGTASSRGEVGAAVGAGVHW